MSRNNRVGVRGINLTVFLTVLFGAPKPSGLALRGSNSSAIEVARRQPRLTTKGTDTSKWAAVARRK